MDDRAAGTEHLTHLPKMSPTAGVGTQDYVAINTAAVLALLIGFAGVLALINEELVVIPIAAIVTAAISLRQIKHSNGTQSGRNIALWGLFFAVSISSFVVCGQVAQALARRADQKALASLAHTFGQDVHDGRYDAAYDLFSQRFKSLVSRQEFVGRLRSMHDQLAAQEKSGLGYGPIVSAGFPGLAIFYTDADTGNVTAQAEIWLTYDGAEGEQRVPSVFRKSAETWEIEAMPALIPVKGK